MLDIGLWVWYNGIIKQLNARKDNTMSQSKYQNMTTEQIIKDFNIVKKVIDYHYEIETEALKTDDIHNGIMAEYIANELAEIDNDAREYDFYETISNKIMYKIVDDVENEICERDNDAMEYGNEHREAMKGNY